MVDEIWKSIPEYEDLYKVSNLGRVMRSGGECPSTYIGRILKSSKNGSGYMVMTLTKNGKSKTFMLHRLVVLAFVGPIQTDLEVNHKNLDKTDNRISNLECVTRSENLLHASRNGRKFGGYNQKGERHPLSKLRTSDVLEIRNLYSTGNYPLRKLSKMYSVSTPTICDVIKRRTWRHL